MNALWLAALALAAPPAADCEHTAERTATVSAAGADLLRLRAMAGSLQVVGRAGLREVRVRGIACASDRRDLDDIRIEAGRTGSEVGVEVRMPEMRGIGNREARLDLVVEVPEGLAVDAEDSSGEAEFSDLGALRVHDSSGSLRIEDIRGELRVRDSSGELRIRGVDGDVHILDTSGGVDVSEVTGAVDVEADSSGDITVTDVRRDVLIRRDSSGGIQVRGVGGDFRVERDGSGGIRYRDVAGQVRIPSKR